jgi:hypothetical protein
MFPRYGTNEPETSEAPDALATNNHVKEQGFDVVPGAAPATNYFRDYDEGRPRH